MADGMNELVPQSEFQADPHKAKAEDFKVAQMGKHGDVPSGADQLADFGNGARHNEDGGAGPHGSGEPTGGDWGAATKGRVFKVSTNKGEGDESPTKMSIPFSIDCESGQITPNVEHTRNKEA